MVMLLKKLEQILLLTGGKAVFAASEARKLVKQAEDKNLQEFEEWAVNYNLSEKIQEQAGKGYNYLKISINDLPMNKISMGKFFDKYGYYTDQDYSYNHIKIFWNYRENAN